MHFTVTVFFTAVENFVIFDFFFQRFSWVFLTANTTMGTFIGTMALNDLIHVNSSFFFKVVNVLSHIHPEQTHVIKHLHKEVCWRRLITIHIKALREFIESLWRFLEVLEVEETLRVRKLVLLQIVVDASFR